MAAKVDHTGIQYGRLTVLYELEPRSYGSMWMCRCECGNLKGVLAMALRAGITRSCGCLYGESKLEDLTGQVFGDLTVIEYLRTEKRGKWKCLCICGRETFVASDKLKAGHTTSCGCARTTRGKPLKFHAGQRSGRWTIESYAGKGRWVCVCDCGVRKKLFPNGIISGISKSCGCFARETTSARNVVAMRGKPFGNRKKGTQWHVGVNGINIPMRSNYEVIYAHYLMREGITFEYEPQVFILRPDLRYIPDFYLPSLNLWIEIKGWTRPEHLEKIRLFQVTTGMEIKLIGYPEILNYLPDGQSYYKFMKLWKQKHNLPLASVESSTTYNQNSLAA